MGPVPTTCRTEQYRAAASVSINKEDRGKLSASQKLKLSKASRERGIDKLTFIKSNGKIVNKFQTIYDLHMQIEALAKYLNFFNMRDVFEIIPENTVELLPAKLEDLFESQADLDQATDELQLEPTNENLKATLGHAKTKYSKAATALEDVDIKQQDLVE